MTSPWSQAVRWVPAYVAIGSNLDDPPAQVQRAFVALAELPRTRLELRSSLYRSAPMGPVEQPDFVNAAAGLLTQLEAPDLLRALKELETRLGRAAPALRWGPRRIDLDLLVHGTTRIESDSITVPHPGIAERAFVLVPLAQIAPSLEVPGVGRVDGLAQRLGAAGLQRIEA
ncbi:MAG TPA: 2-amino-4-hydroxy-6-hydroxymethyldihydropteridine diphosphokinase [Steroidobacteraceae bacterium]